MAAEAISPGKVVGAVVFALQGESVTQAGGRGQEAAAGGRVHAHGKMGNGSFCSEEMTNVQS